MGTMETNSCTTTVFKTSNKKQQITNTLHLDCRKHPLVAVVFYYKRML